MSAPRARASAVSSPLASDCQLPAWTPLLGPRDNSRAPAMSRNATRLTSATWRDKLVSSDHLAHTSLSSMSRIQRERRRFSELLAPRASGRRLHPCAGCHRQPGRPDRAPRHRHQIADAAVGREPHHLRSCSGRDLQFLRRLSPGGPTQGQGSPAPARSCRDLSDDRRHLHAVHSDQDANAVGIRSARRGVDHGRHRHRH